MIKLLKLLKALIATGFATAEQKAEVKTMLKELSVDEQEVLADEVATVDSLSEKDGDEDLAELDKSISAIFSREKKGLKSDVLADVQKYIDAQKDAIAKSQGVYAIDADQDKMAKRKALSTKLRHSLKYLIGDSFDALLVKEMTTDSSGTPYAGYITDDLLSAEIRHLTTEYGVAAREFTTVAFREKSYTANNLATDVSTFWVDEAGSIASTEAVLGKATLELKKLAAIVTLTRELLSEGEIDFVSFLGSRVAEGFAFQEDKAFFRGDGTSTFGGFTGLLLNANTNNVAMASTKTAFSDLTADLLLSMIDATPQGALANGKFYAHRTIRSVLRKLKGSDGHYIYQEASMGSPATVWGRPFVEVEAMPAIGATAVSTAFVLFGDLKKATIRGTRGGIITDRFNAGTVRNVAANADLNLITTDREAVRWISQVGYIAIIPTAVTRLTTAAS